MENAQNLSDYDRHRVSTNTDVMGHNKHLITDVVSLGFLQIIILQVPDCLKLLECPVYEQNLDLSPTTFLETMS